MKPTPQTCSRPTATKAQELGLHWQSHMPPRTENGSVSSSQAMPKFSNLKWDYGHMHRLVSVVAYRFAKPEKFGH